MKKIGIIGITGRMGSILSRKIESHPQYSLGKNQDMNNISHIFQENDYVIDFSSADIIENILEAALHQPKPLLLMTTGWEKEKYLVSHLNVIAQKVPIIIAPNTSLGSWLQNTIACQLAAILDDSYDIDIIDKHHRNKTDRPSGTSKLIINNIKNIKKDKCNSDYTADHHDGARRDQNIEVSILRSGNLAGEHEVIFTSDEEMISIKHVVFNRDLFAKGAINILDWLEKYSPQSGIYDISDVYSLRGLISPKRHSSLI